MEDLRCGEAKPKHLHAVLGRAFPVAVKGFGVLRSLPDKLPFYWYTSEHDLVVAQPVASIEVWIRDCDVT